MSDLTASVGLNLRIGRIDVLGWNRVVVSHASMLDPLGNTVASVDGVEGRFGPWSLLSGIFGGHALRVAVPDIRVARLEIVPIRDTTRGGLTIETALAQVGKKSTGTSSTPTFVELPSIRVASVQIVTTEASARRVQAEIRALSVGLDYSPAGLVVSLSAKQASAEHILSRELKAQVEGQVRLPGTTRAAFDARAGEVPLSGTLEWNASRLGVNLGSREITPEALRGLIPGWPMQRPFSLQATAAGPLDSLALQADARAGASRLAATGSLRLPQSSATLDLHAEQLELGLFAASAPPISLGVDATLEVRWANGLRVEMNAITHKGYWSGEALPATKVSAVYEQGQLEGSAAVVEPELATHVDFKVTPSGRVEFAAKADNLDIEALKQHSAGVTGRAALRVSGALESGRLDADIDVQGRSLRLGAQRVNSARLRGRVGGSLERPENLELSMQSECNGVHLGDVSFDRLELEAHGTTTRQDVQLKLAGERTTLEARTQLTLGSSVVLDGVQLNAQHGAATSKLTARRASFKKGSLSVDGLTVENGSGTLAGSIALEGRRRRVDLTATDLDVATLASSFGVGDTGLSGRVDARARFDAHEGDCSGEMSGQLRDGSIPGASGLSATFTAQCAGQDASGNVSFEVAGVAKGSLDARGKLPRAPLDPMQLARGTGVATLRLSEVDLREVSRRWLSSNDLALDGRAQGEVRWDKAEPSSPPHLAYQLEARGLGVSGAGTPLPGSAIRGDADLRGELHPHDHKLTLAFSDTAGAWITAQIEDSFGLVELFETVETGSPNALLAAPLSAAVVANPRPLTVFGLLGTSRTQGEIGASLNLSGSVKRPEVAGSISLEHRQTSKAEPIRVDASFQYSAARERYTLDARARQADRNHLTLNAAGRLSWLERGFAHDWSTQAEASVERLPLSTFGSVLGLALEGEATGKASLAADPDTFEGSAELGLSGVSVEHRPIGSGSARLNISPTQAEARVSLAAAGSSVELSGDVGLRRTGGALMLDADRGGNLAAAIANLNLREAAPLVRNFATQVSGTLNGHAELRFGAKNSRGAVKPELRANASIRDGTFNLVAGGGLVRQVELRAVASGDGLLHLNLSAAARSREPNLECKADVRWETLLPSRLDAEVRLNKFPLVNEGVSLGSVTIPVNSRPLKISVDNTGRETRVDVTLPAAEIALPERNANLIALDDDPAIVIDAPAATSEPRQKPQNRDGATRLRVQIGKEVRIKQHDLLLPFTGSLERHPSGRLTGTIVLPRGGLVSTLGGNFTIRRGSLAFQDNEVKDGVVAVEADTRTADGTVVNLNVSGTVADPLIRFHSDPARSEQEIVALLLGVQPEDNDQQRTTGQKKTGGAATALAMNQLVRGTALSGVQFGAGRTVEGGSVSTMSVQLGSKVWLERRSVQATDFGTAQTGVSHVVDWRFAPSFSLRTELGGVSGLELRWSHRY